MASDPFPLRPLTPKKIKQIETRRLDAVTSKQLQKQALVRPPFECRICGSKSFSDIKDQWNAITGPESSIPTIAHCCNGCSVVFKDPAKFSKRQRASRHYTQKG